MPELPEVETVVRTLRPVIIGRRILNAEFRQLRVLIGDPSDTAQALAGRKVKGVDRHGKFIVIRLDRGFLVVHLGMTGKLLINAEPSKCRMKRASSSLHSPIFERPPSKRSMPALARAGKRSTLPH